MRRLQIISVHHRSHSSADRMSLQLSRDQEDDLMGYLSHVLHTEGVVLVSTCNRIELYIDAVTDVRFQAIDRWISITGSTVASSSIKTYIGTSACARYIMRVSSGLESAVLGDDQILSQVKKAYERSRATGRLSTLLERLYQSIMHSHKQICRETTFKQQSVSLAYAGLKAISDYYSRDSLRRKEVLIIGVGDMAAQVAKYSQKFAYASVTIANRTVQRASDLAGLYGYQSCGLENLRPEEYDIVVSCIDQGYTMVGDWSAIGYFMDLSAASHGLSNLLCPHILLDQLQAHINAKATSRRGYLPVVKRILHEHCEKYLGWVHAWQPMAVAAE